MTDNIIEGFRFLSDNLQNVCERVHKERYQEDLDYVNCWTFTDVIERQIVLDKLEVFDSKFNDRTGIGSFLDNYDNGRYVMIITYSDPEEIYVHWFALLIDEYGYAHLLEVRNNGKLYLVSTKSADLFDDIILILEGVKPDNFYNVLVENSSFLVVVYSRKAFNIQNLSSGLI